MEPIFFICDFFLWNPFCFVTYRIKYTIKKILYQPQLIVGKYSRLRSDFSTVVKELRSKMLGQHPGYFKAVFLKKTQIIIVSIYEYTVYIMF